MTVKELIKELEEIAERMGDNVEVTNAEEDTIFSVCESVNNEKIIIYF